MMNVALFTLFFDNYKPLADVVLPNWQEYSTYHGYDLLPFCGGYREHAGRPIGFQKLQFVYDELFVNNRDYDVAWVLDLDVLITNFNIRVEDFLDDDHDYFVTTGVHGLCNGSFIIKKNQKSKEILEYILANKHGYDNEQNMLKYHLHEFPLKGRVKQFPYYSFSSLMFDLYPERAHLTKHEKRWQCGDFVLHLAALSLEKRIEIFKSEIVTSSIIK